MYGSVKAKYEQVLLNQWVEPAYMAPRSRAAVQAQMERRSEACLKEFLQPQRCQDLLQQLRSSEVAWEEMGPCSRRRYEAVSAPWLASRPRDCPVKALLHLFSSTAFCRLLADCTDLTLTAYRALELQRWRAMDFTLIPPREEYQHPRLEAVLYLGAPDRPLYGGVTTYLAPEDPDAAGAGPQDNAALVYLPPDHNTLNLVYCDAGAASFRKYLSKLAMQNDDCFYVLTCSYHE